MIEGELIARQWRKVDVKLSIDGAMHVLRWRRRWLLDEVLFDERRVGISTGLFSRETMFGFDVKTADDHAVRLLFAVDPESGWDDWSGEMRPRGVRLETAERPVIAFGSLGPDRAEPFRNAFDRAVKALGLS